MKQEFSDSPVSPVDLIQPQDSEIDVFMPYVQKAELS